MFGGVKDIFGQDLLALERYLHQWKDGTEKKLRAALNKTGQIQTAAAVKRVAVDKGTLKQKIFYNVYKASGDWFVATGTNQREYPEYLEFGTEYIANGAVKRLGTSPLITDQQAIHDWPAKSGNAINKTSARIDTSGGTKGRLRNSKGHFLKGRAQEQLPWLRPAGNATRKQTTLLFDEALAPPQKKRIA